MDVESVFGDPYRSHRFPKQIISHCAWLYLRFGVSFRDVEERMAARGVLVSVKRSLVRREDASAFHAVTAGIGCSAPIVRSS